MHIEECKSGLMSTLSARKIDLHCHSRFSDGRLTVAELIDRAHNMQVDVLAITDHDTVEATEVAKAYQATQSRPLTLIPGIELSTKWHNFEIHIVGLNMNIHDELFQKRLLQQQASRDERAQRISDKLAKAGFADCLQDAAALAGEGQITRAHFARVLLNRGVVDEMQKAFDKYLGKGERAYVTSQWIDITTAIRWISEAGGKAVLAHPCLYDMSTKWLRRLLAEFKAAGGHGMEVIHGNLDPQRRQLLAGLCAEHELQASAGSDFHMPGRWTELGKNLTLPPELVPIWHDWDLN